MINIIRDKKDVTKAQLWEAYRDMVEHYEGALEIVSTSRELVKMHEDQMIYIMTGAQETAYLQLRAALKGMGAV